MSLNFREVLPRTMDTLRPLLRAGWELTILRDVEGRVRVVADGAPQPDQTACEDMESKLQAALGEWLGENTPVWRVPQDKKAKANKPKKALDIILAEIKRMRRSVETGIFLVERHVSREAWTGACPHDPPWPRSDVELGAMPPIITFFSHKGGVGRTTALVATAANLAREGKKVFLLDLDLEAPGLDSLFSTFLAPDLGAPDFLIAPSLDDNAVQSACARVDEVAIIGEGEALRVLTAGKVDDDYLEMLARLDVDASANRDSLMARLRDLFKLVPHLFPDLDYILVDARAGFHDLGGLMLASLTHGAVMVLTANPQSENGLQRVARLLKAPNLKDGSSPVPLLLVHGMAPELGSRDRGAELQSLRERAYDLLTADYYPAGAVPGLEAENVAHDLVPLSWAAPLRGRGGALDEDVMALLCSGDYQTLAKRLCDTFRP